MNPEDEEVIDDIEEETEEQEEEETTEDRGDAFEDEEEDETEEDAGETEDTEGTDEDEDDSDGDAEEGTEEPIENQIPQGRFNEVIQQRERERERNEQLLKQNEELIGLLKKGAAPEADKVKQYDYDTAEEAHMEAVLEGDATKAKAIRAEIRAAERAEFLKEAATYKDEALKGAAAEAGRIDDETKFTQIISRSAEDYEFLNPDSKGYNQTAVDEINDVFEGLVATGKGKAIALQRAIDIVAPKFGESSQRALGEDKKSNRRKAAVKKNTKAANKQPPRMKGKTTRDKTITEVDVLTMSDRSFKKLSKTELAELRGDKV